MATISMVPEFTTQDSLGVKREEEVKETPTDVGEEEKETPTAPPAEKQPATEKAEMPPREDTGDNSALERAKLGLESEILRLRKEISELRGSRRELKQEQLIKAQGNLDELKDLNPQDVDLIDRVLRAKGLITKEEAHRMFYESVKQEELNKFLDKYPEYKPENDPGDTNWSLLQRELGYYRMPDDPHRISEILDRAHRGIAPRGSSSDRGAATKTRQREVAGLGAGGVQRSSSAKSLDPRRRALLEAGGWSEEEIKNIEKRM